MHFSEYKNLTSEEREFFTYQQLSKIDALDSLGDVYAGKWVEKAVVGTVVIIMTGFLGSLLWVASWHTPSAQAASPDTSIFKK